VASSRKNKVGGANPNGSIDHRTKGMNDEARQRKKKTGGVYSPFAGTIGHMGLVVFVFTGEKGPQERASKLPKTRAEVW